MKRSKHEQPWTPAPSAAHQWILVNPEGTRHLLFDLETGDWQRIYADNTSEYLGVGRAMALRPSDVDTIIKWTVMWFARAGGLENDQAARRIDEMASGVREIVVHLASGRT